MTEPLLLELHIRVDDDFRLARAEPALKFGTATDVVVGAGRTNRTPRVSLPPDFESAIRKSIRPLPECAP